MKKYSILIVDDDALVRIALKTLVNWEENGYTLIGEAENGQEALKNIEALEPDLVLLDIEMPEMNGIEVLKKLKESRSKVKAVVLSSHNDIELVKSAMKLGAEDYILKFNMDFGNLLSVIERVTETMIETETMVPETLNKQIYKNINVLREAFFKRLLSGFFSDTKELEKDMAILDVRFGGETCSCYIVHIHEMKKAIFDNEMNAMRKFAVINILEEITEGYAFEQKTGVFIAFGIKDVMDGAVDFAEDVQTTDYMVAVAKRIRQMMLEYLDLYVTVGIGFGDKSILGLQEAYQLADSAMVRRLSIEDGQIYMGRDNDKTGTFEEYSVVAYRERLIDALSLKDYVTIESAFQGITKDLSSKKLAKETIGRTLVSLHMIVEEFFQKEGLYFVDFIEKDCFRYDHLLLIESKEMVNEVIHQLKSAINSYLDSCDDGSNKGMVTKAAKYIEKNYATNISLGEVAQHVGLNASYLSNQMKQHFGKNYSEYIIDMRIEQAKKLIRMTDQKIYEISQSVGYDNTFYFTRLFKQRMKMTPLEYRNLATNED